MNRRTLHEDWNLTSLMDVLFLLIMFLVLIGNFEERVRIPLNLPEASSEGNAQGRDRALSIAITRAGEVSVEGQAIALDDFSRTLERLKPEKVLLHVDREAQFGVVFATLELLREKGITQVLTAGRGTMRPGQNTRPAR